MLLIRSSQYGVGWTVSVEFLLKLLVGIGLALAAHFLFSGEKRGKRRNAVFSFFLSVFLVCELYTVLLNGNFALGDYGQNFVSFESIIKIHMNIITRLDAVNWALLLWILLPNRGCKKKA